MSEEFSFEELNRHMECDNMETYKPLHNPYIDRIFFRIFLCYSGYNVPKLSMTRRLVRWIHEGRRMAVGLIADQSPNPNEAYHWTVSLNKGTSFMDDAERLAKWMKFPVSYCELQRLGRGYCRVTFNLICEYPAEINDDEITGCFAWCLEHIIYRVRWFIGSGCRSVGN